MKLSHLDTSLYLLFSIQAKPPKFISLISTLTISSLLNFYFRLSLSHFSEIHGASHRQLSSYKSHSTLLSPLPRFMKRTVNFPPTKQSLLTTRQPSTRQSSWRSSREPSPQWRRRWMIYLETCHPPHYLKRFVSIIYEL